MTKYLSFSGLNKYFEFTKKQIQNISEKNQNELRKFTEDYITSMCNFDRSWYGEEWTPQQIIEGVKQYTGMEELTKMKNLIKSKLDPKIMGKIKKKKLDFNEMGFGVFSFERFAMGLYRKREFFCENLNRTMQYNEIEEKKGIITTKIENYPVTTRLEVNPKTQKPKYRTNVKKVFVYFPEKPKTNKTINFYVICGSPAMISKKNMTYNSIPTIILSEQFIKAGFKVKIIGVIGSYDSSNTAFSFVTLKDYHTTLDINLVSLVASEAAFFRQEGFKGIVAIHDYFKNKVPDSLGSKIKTRMVRDVLNQQGLDPKTNVILEDSYDESHSIETINTVINYYSNETKSNN